MERTANKVAITFENSSMTYGEMNRRANKIAHYLQTLQVGPQVLVGICMQRSPDMAIALLGILKAGAAYVPLDPDYPQERLAVMLSDSQLPVLITEQNLLSRLPKHQATVVCLDADWQKISQHSDQNLKSSVTPDNLAYTIYTSGSTGKPKGVQVTHRSTVNFLHSMSQTPGLSNSDVMLAVTTVCFDIAALELYLPLAVGAKVELVKREVATDGTKLIAAIEQSGATVMQATPATWRMLLAAGWQGNPKLKILCGGEAMSPDLADKLLSRSASVWNMYGPTETTIWSTVHRVQPGETPVPIGHPIANTQIYLVDPDKLDAVSGRSSDAGNELSASPCPSAPASSFLVPVGEPGELLIGGVGLARGYLNRPELTAEKFIPDPFSIEPGARLYRTGDLARYRSDGTIEYIGRIDHQVKLRGFRIELGDIETALYQHPDVRETVVIAREDVPGDKRLVAYIVPKSGVEAATRGHDDAGTENHSASPYLCVTTSSSPTHRVFTREQLQQIRDFLKQRLPEYMVPSAFVILDVLPLTPNGKVDRKALRAPQGSRDILRSAFVAPRTPIEEQLTQMWAKVLGVEQVGVHDNFFDLGGHSLLAAQLLSLVREIFQVELPLHVLFGAPTVAELAQAITGFLDSHSQPENITLADLPDLLSDAMLDASIYPEASCIASQQEQERILLTGATGFLGAFLLHELLEQTQAKIYCLVRAETLEEGAAKLRSNQERYLLTDNYQEHRIIPVLGDLSQPRLGLSRAEFHNLASTINLIYHNGAFVNLVYPYSALREANVLGIKEILKLAASVQIKPVHFISTLDVFQSPHYAQMDVILEDDNLDGGALLADGYSQSKWVGEKLMMAARSRGIPTSIYRPSMVVGHSQTGASQSNDLVCRLIKGLVQLGSAPKLDLRLSLTPVDYVSRAIIHLSQQPASVNKAFHLVTPQPVSLSQIVHELRSCGYPIEWVNYDKWQSLLLQAASVQANNALSPLLFLFTEWGSQNQKPYLETSALVSQAFDCQNTSAGLAEVDITCPPIDTQVWRAYFSYLGLDSGDCNQRQRREMAMSS
jgi:thioester reductase-like protein/amino acid adenylation domain-containing protein